MELKDTGTYGSFLTKRTASEYNKSKDNSYGGTIKTFNKGVNQEETDLKEEKVINLVNFNQNIAKSEVRIGGVDHTDNSFQKRNCDNLITAIEYLKKYGNNNYINDELLKKKEVEIAVLKKQIEFLLTGISFIIFSLIGLLVFSAKGSYIIHPLLYIFTLLMGIGWSLTAIVSMKGNKEKIYGNK